MADNETPLGFISYPGPGDESWFDEDSSGQGLEDWLASIELFGLPTYPTFDDVPGAGAPITNGDQRQFAAVVADRTVYRTDGDEWVPWFGSGTSERPLPNTTHFESASIESLDNGIAGDGNEIELLHGDAGEYHPIGLVSYLPGESVTITSDSFADLGSSADWINNPSGSGVNVSNLGSVYARVSGRASSLDQPITIRHRDDPETEATVESIGGFHGPVGEIDRSASGMEAKLDEQTNGDEVELEWLSIQFFRVIE